MRGVHQRATAGSRVGIPETLGLPKPVVHQRRQLAVCRRSATEKVDVKKAATDAHHQRPADSENHEVAGRILGSWKFRSAFHAFDSLPEPFRMEEVTEADQSKKKRYETYKKRPHSPPTSRVAVEIKTRWLAHCDPNRPPQSGPS